MRRGEHHGALKEALIDAALELLDASGIDAVTIRATARKASVSHAAPVNHFPDLRALLTGVAIHCFAELKQSIAESGFQQLADSRQQMLAFIDAFHAYALAKPNRYRLMWRRDMLDENDPGLNAMTDTLFADVTEMAKNIGGYPGVSGMSWAVAACAAIHGYILLRIDGNFVGLADEKSGLPRHQAVMEALFGKLA